MNRTQALFSNIIGAHVQSIALFFLSKQLSLVPGGAETAVDFPCLMSGLTGNIFTQGASEEPLDWENMPLPAQRHPHAINHKFNCLNI